MLVLTITFRAKVATTASTSCLLLKNTPCVAGIVIQTPKKVAGDALVEHVLR